MKTVEVSCNVCGTNDASEVARGKDHEYPSTSDDVFHFVRCRRCDHLYLNPRPAESELDRIYPPTYYAYRLLEEQEKASKQAKSSMIINIMRRLQVRRMKNLATHLFGKTDRTVRILDLGCGDGTQLDNWKAVFGNKVETWGVEMSERAAKIAESRGHKVLAKRIEDCDLPEKHFDLVFSSHVIEHVPDPREFLRNARKALTSDGFLLLDTPNIDAVDAKIFGAGTWGGYHIPRHWNLFNVSTLSRLAEGVGFQFVEVRYMPINMHWIWSLHAVLYEKYPRMAQLFEPSEVLFRKGLFNFGLIVFFQMVETINLALFRKTSQMRVLFRRIPGKEVGV